MEVVLSIYLQGAWSIPQHGSGGARPPASRYPREGEAQGTDGIAGRDGTRFPVASTAARRHRSTAAEHPAQPRHLARGRGPARDDSRAVHGSLRADGGRARLARRDESRRRCGARARRGRRYRSRRVARCRARAARHHSGRDRHGARKRADAARRQGRSAGPLAARDGRVRDGNPDRLLRGCDHRRSDRRHLVRVARRARRLRHRRSRRRDHLARARSTRAGERGRRERDPAPSGPQPHRVAARRDVPVRRRQLLRAQRVAAERVPGAGVERGARRAADRDLQPRDPARGPVRDVLRRSLRLAARVHAVLRGGAHHGHRAADRGAGRCVRVGLHRRLRQRDDVPADDDDAARCRPPARRRQRGDGDDARLRILARSDRAVRAGCGARLDGIVPGRACGCSPASPRCSRSSSRSSGPAGCRTAWRSSHGCDPSRTRPE